MTCFVFKIILESLYWHSGLFVHFLPAVLGDLQLGLDFIISEMDEFTGLFIAKRLLLNTNHSPKEVREFSDSSFKVSMNL